LTVVKTGNEELDRRLGGIPHPTTIVIEGEQGAGKTVLAAQIAQGFLLSGMDVLYATTEALSYDLVHRLRGVKIDLTRDFLEGTFRVAPVNVRGFSWDSHRAETLLTTLLDHLREVSAPLVVVDSLTLMAAYAGDRVLLDFVRCCRQLEDFGRSVVITIHPQGFEESILAKIRSMFDMYFRIKAVTIGGRRLKSLERIKNSGGLVGSDVISFDIDPSLGLRVVPLSLSRG